MHGTHRISSEKSYEALRRLLHRPIGQQRPLRQTSSETAPS